MSDKVFMNNIYDIIKNNANCNPDSECILDKEGKKILYKELLQHIESSVVTLRSWGINRNDRVAIVLPNGPEMAVSFLTISCGATSAPLNPGYREKEYHFYLSDLQAKAIIVKQGVASPARTVATELGIPILELESDVEKPGLFRLYSKQSIEKTVQDLDFCQSQDIALVLHTSGTTSRPKIVPLSQANICNSAANIRKTLQLQTHDRCLNVMPLFHIHGLMGVLLSSITCGASVCCTSGFNMEYFFPWLEKNRPTWYSAVPTMHQAVLLAAVDNQHIAESSSLRFIRSSSSSLPPVILKELEEAFSVPVIESYGMTEASHQMTSNPLPPAKRKAGSVGIAAGPEVAIMDVEGNLLPLETEGEIVIRGENVTYGYENNPQANETAFTNGWFRTGDIGSFDKDKYLYIKGRVKEIINRGGEKISPREVDEILLQLPEIQQAVTFAVPHKRLGEDVAAAVILHKGQSLSQQQIRNFAFDNLADFKVPSQILFVDKVPLGPTGKMQRIGLADKLQHLFESTHAVATTESEKSIQQIWLEVLGIKDVGIDDNFFILGGDSLLGMQVISYVNKHLNCNVSVESLFRLPTIRELAILVETSEDGGEKSIINIPPTEKVPLSFTQERMWYFDHFAPNSAIYNRASNVRLFGPLNVETLQQALNAIVKRHEVLCSFFVELEGLIVQEVQEHCSLPLPVVNLEELLVEQQHNKIQEIAFNEARKTFHLQSDFKIRTKLVRLHSQNHLLLITFHHSAFDASCESIFYRDLKHFYTQISTGQQHTLPSLKIQYGDFAYWQKQQNFSSRLIYWKEKLKHPPQLLDISPNQRQVIPSYRGKKCTFSFDNEIYTQLQEISKQQQVTVFMTLFAIYGILLSKYSRQRDLIIGVPFSERNSSELENLIGVFINTLPLRIDLSENLRFCDFLQNVREITTEALENNTPLQKIINAINIKRSANHSPLFQALFIFENFAFLPEEIHDLQIKAQKIDIGKSITDLLMEFTVTKEGLQGYLEYATDLFSAHMMENFILHYKNIVTQIIKDSTCRLDDIDLLTTEEYNKIIYDFNHHQKEYSSDRSLKELFEEQVMLQPNNIALHNYEYALSYLQVNEKANQISWALYEKGCRANDVVALYAHRDIDTIIAIYALFKLGAVYCPVNPLCPQIRIDYIIEDSESKFILSSHSDNVQYKQPFLQISDCYTQEYRCDNPEYTAQKNDAVYIIYTSGTTGKPKGVVINLGQLLRVMLWRKDYWHLNKQIKILQTLSLSFDFSFWEIEILLFGGTLYVLPDELLYNQELCVDFICKYKINCLHIVPSFFKHLLGAGKNLPTLKIITTGGEKLSFELIEKTYNLAKNCLIYDGYGVTEATINSTMTCWTSKQIAMYKKLGKSTIGKVCPGFSIYIVDDHLKPVPIGVVGEIVIGGEGVADGYWKKPEQTAQRFLKSPFVDGERIYRTGDLGRYFFNGDIEFLGRKDLQVKIQGYRIELEEIEFVLTQHELINEAVVIRKEQQNYSFLVAYITLQKNVFIDDASLSLWATEYLPQYMIPTQFIILESLPLTVNGKIDRAVLLQTKTSLLGKKYIAATTKIEKKLTSIWQEVLVVEKIGMRDNFFVLGGHSLLAIVLVSRIQEQLDVSLQLRTIFDAPTIEQLAKYIEQNKKLHSITARNCEEYPLSFAQKRLWFLYMLEPESVFYNMSSSKELHGDLNKEYLQKAWGDLVERHTTLRTYLQINSNEDVVQRISENNITIDFVEASSYEDAEKKIEFALKKPFVLTELPLVRCQLIYISNELSILNITIHHIISDFWSMNILWKDLSELYNSYKEAREIKLPILQVEYGDFCVWQQQQNIAKQRRYWLQQFDNYSALNIFTDKPRATYQTFRGANYIFDVDETTTSQLQRLAKENNCSLFIVILTAFNVFLNRYSGQQDIVVGCPIANRHYGQIENNIGFFLNTLALRTQIDSEETFQELLQRVKEICLQAYTHQDYPFEQLVEDLNPTRDTSRNPLFQIMLNMMEDSHNEHTFGDIKTTNYKRKSDATKFDITLYVRQQEKLQFTFRYNTDLFCSETIERMARHFAILLKNITPQQKITQIKMNEDRIEKAFAKKLAVVPTTNDYIAFTKEEIEQSIYDRYSQQAEKFSENIAVCATRDHLSYKQLATAASNLADVLNKKLGEEPHRIALLCSHSANMIIAILGVLKAGKTYVPLESHYFSERQRDIVIDADVEAVVTESIHMDKARTLPDINIINIDELEANIDKSNTKSRACNDSIAYLLYTSGSTGIPKGVVQNHRNVLHFIRNYINNLKITSSDRLMLIASYNFDASIMDIFGALLSGASLYLFDLKNEGIENLASWMVKNKITIYHSTPTIYRHFTSALQDEKFPDLRLVVLGGEEVYKKDVELYRRYFDKKCLFVNGFGPTESTVTLQNIFDYDSLIVGNSVAIGYPVEDTEIVLLNEQQQLTEVYGEIAINSEYLAIEYWRQSQMTDKAFISHPQNKEQRLYCTGDMGYLQANGQIQFAGRKDFQVKIRGIRVELGEIEAVIEQYPFVIENTVVYERKKSFLVAYIVENSNCEIEDLKDFLLRKLPGYMIPTHFVVAEKLPLNSNGKVDKKKLTALDVATITEEYIAPQTEVEKTLCLIWQEVLGLEKIGIRDDFFALGGHSLLVITVMNKIRDFLQLDEDDYETLPLSLMLINPTIAKLAQTISQINSNTDTNNNDVVIRMNKQTVNNPIFLVHAAHVDPISYHHLCRFLDDKVTAYTIRTEELDPHASIEETASYHIKNIRRVQPHGPYVIGGMCMGGLVAYEVARQLQNDKEHVRFVFIMDSINIPGMENYKSRMKHKQKKRQRKIKNLWKIVEFFKHLLCGDFQFISQKMKKIKSNIERQKKKISDPRMRLRKKMRDRLRIMRDAYHPQNYNGTIIYVRSEKIEGKFSEKRLQELAKEVLSYKVQGTIHKDVSRPIFAEKTSEIIQNKLKDF